MAAIFSDGKDQRFDNVQLLKREDIALIEAWVQLGRYQERFTEKQTKWYPALYNKLFKRDGNMNRIELEELLSLLDAYGIDRPPLRFHPVNESWGGYYRLKRNGSTIAAAIAKRRSWREKALQSAQDAFSDHAPSVAGRARKFEAWLATHEWDGFRSTSRLLDDYRGHSGDHGISISCFGRMLARAKGVSKSVYEGRKGYRRETECSDAIKDAIIAELRRKVERLEADRVI